MTELEDGLADVEAGMAQKAVQWLDLRAAGKDRTAVELELAELEIVYRRLRRKIHKQR